MNWPTMSDYQEAIQNPANCFSDPQLKTGAPTLNALGLPQPVTGGFCSVYQVANGKTRWAVRCFLHNIKDLRDRYHKISGYLRWKKLKQMVGFEYLPEGIRIRGDWHPALKMEWVDGHTLNLWVDQHVKDGRALRKLADRWVELMDGLERQRIGHCDLQHGNVLVDGSGNIRLIDYDGMYVPPLRGRGSHEKGHPAYQHPEREGEDFDESVDRFSALVIHTSLIALAESPELWKRYYDDDNLIFKRADFQNPGGALVFQDLEKVGGQTAALASALREACERRLDKTPRLRDVISGRARARAGAPAPPAPSAQITPLPVSPRPGSRRAASRPSKSRPASRPASRPSSRRASSVPAATSPPPGVAPRGAGGAAAAAALPSPARQATPKPVLPSLVPVKPAPAPATKPTGTQPAWMATPAARGHTAPQPAGSSPPPAKLPDPHPNAAATPRHGSKLVPVPQAAPPAAPAPAAATRPAATPPVLAPVTGWNIEWTRPGELNEQHLWQVPIYGTRETPRMSLGIAFGTRQEKYVERYEEKVAERGTHVGGHRSTVTSLAFSNDGRLLASSSRDGTLRVWSVQSGRESFEPLETRSPVLAMALVPDRTMLAAVLKNRRLLIWDFGLRRRVIHLEAPDRSSLKAVAVSNDGRLVAAGGARREIYLWQTDRGVAAGEIRGVSGRIECLAFTPDASGIVCGTHNSRLEHFERGTGEARWRIRTGFGRIASLAVPPRSSGVLGGAAGGTVARWDLRDGSEIQHMRPMPDRLASFVVSPDGSLVLVGSMSGEAFITETSPNKELSVLDGHPGPVTACAIAGTGKAAATGTTDGTVRLWVLH